MGHLVQPPCRSRVTYSRLHRTLSRRVLNISREGDMRISPSPVTWRKSKGRIPKTARAFLPVQGLLLVPLHTSLTLPTPPPHLVFLQGNTPALQGWCPGVSVAVTLHGPTLSSCTWGVLGAAGLGDREEGCPTAKPRVLVAAKAAR